jgi:bacillolysin
MKKNIHFLPLMLALMLPLSLLAQNNPFSEKRKKASSRIRAPKHQAVKSSPIKPSSSGLKSLTFPSDPRFQTLVKKSKGNVACIQGNPKKRKAKFGSKEEAMQSCYDYLNDVSGTTGIKNPSSQFDIINIQDETSGHKHIKLQQKFLGVPIYGAEIILHFKDGEPYLLNGRFHAETGLTNVAPVYGSAYAINKTITDLTPVTTFQQFSAQQKELLDYSAPGSELIIHKSDDDKFKLAWHISIRPNVLEIWDYFIDANTGEVLQKYNHTCSSGTTATTTSPDLNGVSRTIDSWLIGSTYYMINTMKPMFSSATSAMPDQPAGAIWTLDAGNTDLASVNQITNSSNSWSDTATSAHYNAGVCFDYYKTVHNRNSLDGQGGTIISVINVTQNGQGMDNAYWNGKFMAYGNGNTAFTPLAGGLDVAAHEMTHGVISNTANLEYLNESGAINESMADVFGCMVDSSNWTIGENVVLPSAFPSGALRDLSDPHNTGTSSDYFWQPRVYSEYVYTSSDNGGVHTNSGIPNYAYYLFATGAGMSKYKAQKIYYLALDKYLVRSSQFIDLRIAVIAAATQLYGAGSAEVTAAGAAFDAVEIYDGSGGNYQQSIPAVSGQEYMLVTNTDPFYPYSLYIADFAGGSLRPISTSPLFEKPSVTDDGSVAYFTDTLGNIRSITLDPLNPIETMVTNDSLWEHVAISKDGSKLAATSLIQDTSIYIYNFSDSAWSRFYLYNPTFTQGITTDGPIYADVIEWDFTGEYLIYDCYNKVTNDTSKIDYWDMGIIKVWDNTKDSLGDGNIQKIFSQLQSGINVGNPTFSKNSSYIIAFDYIDALSYTQAIMASNIQTGSTNLICYTNTLGYPTYSKDDNIIAFAGLDYYYNEDIFQIGLNADKISSSTSIQSTGLYSFSLPDWYAKGSRVTSTVNTKKSSISLSLFPNPTEDRITVKYDILSSSMVEISITNSLGQPIKKLISENQAQGTYNYDFSLDGLPGGTYMLKVITGSESNVYKIVKIK